MMAKARRRRKKPPPASAAAAPPLVMPGPSGYRGQMPPAPPLVPPEAMLSIKINGWYFGGSRGLRQGDPLSPYLFAMVMEVLSMKLNQGTMQQGFQFHWRTKESNFTRLFFYDDIIIFCHGSLVTVNIINSCIHSFSLFSGLIPNVQKSRCFLANTDPNTSQNIISTLGFSCGSTYKIFRSPSYLFKVILPRLHSSYSQDY